MTDLSNFWSKTRRNKDTGCLEWTRSLFPRGYGQYHVNRKPVLAHRFSYEVTKGAIPKGMFVCHTCDNPKCVEPNHLFLGTPQENMTDKVLKNRQTRMPGEENPMSKLTESQVLEIRAMSGPQSEIARKFGVSRSLIGQIKQKVVWAHLD